MLIIDLKNICRRNEKKAAEKSFIAFFAFPDETRHAALQTR
jgi:hypothetical protein